MLEKISHKNFFHIVALDHRESLRKLMRPENPESVSRKEMEEVKLNFARIFCKKASGILLDPVYGRPAIRAIKGKCGLIISLEESGYKESKEGRITSLIEGFCPEKAKKMGADAAKLLIYFNPSAKVSKKQKDLVRKTAKECEDVGLPLICEFLVYPFKEKNFEKEKAKLIIKASKEISRLGIQLLKTEFPGKIGIDDLQELEKNCEKITKVSKVPWVLLSRGINFEEFKAQLKISMMHGASGFMVGRALWQDYFKLRTKKERFLKECVKKLEELKRIAS